MPVPTIVNQVDDAGPLLTNGAGSLYSIFKQFADSLGFDLPFDDPSKSTLVMRARVGNRYFVKIVDDATHHAGSNDTNAFIQTFESMTNIDTGTGLLSEGYFQKAHNTTDRQYTIASDGRTLHFFNRAPTGNHAWIAFGDFGPALLSGPGGVFTGYINTFATSFTNTVFFYNFNSISSFLKVSNNGAGTAADALVMGLGTGAASFIASANAAPSSGQYFIFPLWLGIEGKEPFGLLPGVVKPFNSTKPANPTTRLGAPSIDGGVTDYLEIPVAQRFAGDVNEGSFFLDIGDWGKYYAP